MTNFFTYLSNNLGQAINYDYLFYFIGESNAGGQGRNTSALASEIDNDPNVQILNNTTFNVENLQIEGTVATGKNNILGHFNLDPDEDWHGLELQLGNRYSEFSSPVYLVKCGQGGSIISEWNDGGSYDTILNTRISAMESALSGKALKRYVFCTIGINDMIAGTNAATYGVNLENWLIRVKEDTNCNRIFITTFEGVAGMTDYNTQIINVSNSLDYVTRIDTTAATFVNIYHWDYAGLKTICNSMLNLI